MRTLILTRKVFTLLNEVITIEKCKKVLEQKGNKYTDEQVEAIRCFIYTLIKIDGNNEKTQRYGKRNIIHESINR